MSGPLRFEVEATCGESSARLGLVETPHGVFDTPAFMPVGTAATVKGMLPEQVAETGAQILLGNTYHLMLRPGAERVAELARQNSTAMCELILEHYLWRACNTEFFHVDHVDSKLGCKDIV